MTVNQAYFKYIGWTLKKIMEKGKTWDKIPTSVCGVSLVILPDNSLGVQILPTDVYGNSKTKKFYILKYLEVFYELRRIVNDPKLEELLKILAAYNPEKRRYSKKVLDLGAKKEELILEGLYVDDEEPPTESH